jgi:hypothetical protein
LEIIRAECVEEECGMEASNWTSLGISDIFFSKSLRVTSGKSQVHPTYSLGGREKPKGTGGYKDVIVLQHLGHIDRGNDVEYQWEEINKVDSMFVGNTFSKRDPSICYVLAM